MSLENSIRKSELLRPSNSDNGIIRDPQGNITLRNFSWKYELVQIQLKKKTFGEMNLNPQ